MIKSVEGGEQKGLRVAGYQLIKIKKTSNKNQETRNPINLITQ